MDTQLKNQLVNILKISCFALFAGRAWQHLIWDIPLRSLLWDQQMMEGIITSLTHMTWFEYATSSIQDQMIQAIKIGFGVFYLIAAVSTIFIHTDRKWTGWVMILSSSFLTFLALLYCKEKFYHLGQFFEYSCQIFTPIGLYLLVFRNIPAARLLVITNIMIALTFTCHGFYALGVYPQPGHFVDMTIRGFLVNENTARSLLKVFGVLDIILSITIFIPLTARVSVTYAVIWGGLTALARIVTNFYWDFPMESLNQWMPEFLFRVPHALIPLVALMIVTQIHSSTSKNIQLAGS